MHAMAAPRAGCSKRPSSKAAASEGRGGTYRTSCEPFAICMGRRTDKPLQCLRPPRSLLNVEGLNDARTKLADFFNSLLLVQLPGDRVGLEAASCR